MIGTYRFLLALFSGLMLGIAFPPVPSGLSAAFAFVPFFILFESIEEYGLTFRYSYLIFLIFNVAGLYWTGGFTHCKDLYMMIAGILLLLFHPFFFCVPVIGWLFIRRQLGFKFAIFSFPFLWVAFEYLHCSTEVGFPWLTLGNTQTYDIALIQIASITGVFGISFWLLWMNVLAFLLFVKLYLKEWNAFSYRSVVTLLGIVLLYFLPKFYGNYILSTPKEEETKKVKIAVVQPNIDTFEKWSGDYEIPLQIVQKLTNEIADKQVDLVIWPETAMPFYILHPKNRYFFELVRRQIDTLNVSLLTGMPDIYYYSERDNIPRSSKISVDGQRYDTFNSCIMISPHREELQKYAKIVLVPFAERVPFSEELSFLNVV